MLMRTDPFRDLDRLTQQLLGTAVRPATMPMDAYRKGDTFLVMFDLPGTSLESIDLTVEQNVLTVHAQRTAVEDDVEMIVAERPSGTFTRQVFLGDTLDADNVAADYTAGVLTLRIPVREEAKPRKVSISSKDTPRSRLARSYRPRRSPLVARGIRRHA
jgi:HSP20 family protein